ncbi:MAG: ABC transporter permease subunit [Spirochaetaceae bacterium]|nr:MAG: ABC transporter permease subunit [Spirochaetaceae bacterium]
MKSSPRFTRLLWVVLLLAVWEITRRLSSASVLAFPSVAMVAGRLVELLATGLLMRQVAVSLGLISGGLVLAALPAGVLVLVSSRVRWVDSLLETMVTLFHPLPGIALLPVIILWFGIGVEAVMVVIVHSVFWPLITNLRAGREAMPAVYRRVAENLGMSAADSFCRITLPAVTPYLISALRICWARSWRALISAEMVFGAVVAGGGLGWFLHSRRVFMDTTGLFVGLVVIMAVGVFVEDGVFRFVESRTVRRWGMNP